ncbi:zinc finger domain-containing protein [Streptomyces sp. HC307]
MHGCLPLSVGVVAEFPDPHCPRCGTPLRRCRLAGRTTMWCPRCQPGP